MRNRLNEETSPYLLQHAGNPVHWQPWDDAALAAAKDADKPILLSVGYSACHWCHVMAHESFEDDATAKLMNDLFVTVKVDREERPDLDKIYQLAHQLSTGQAGGWPLTVFLTPDDHVPFYTGTYFPKDRRYGMPAFREVLEAVANYYRTNRAAIREHGARLTESFEQITTGAADDFAGLSHAPIERAVERLAASHDREHGGFGGAPKFPHATALELLLMEAQRLGRGTTDADSVAAAEQMLAIVMHSLDRMAVAGLYDQLGGGFFRYSVDREWSIPHFEKMLYDNAALLSLYAETFAATITPLYGRIAVETAEWVIGGMQAPNGGFYCTLDADSEHEEGKFYVWTQAEFDALLPANESRLAKRVLGLTSADGTPTAPNFEHRFWHLHLPIEPTAAGAEIGVDADAAIALFDAARARLLEARGRRVWPGRDEKILTAWNGLMICGLARAARRLVRPEYAEAATRALDFIRAELWQDGRLKAAYKDGRARFAAYLDDYALLAAGVLELLQCRWRDGDLDFACALADVLLARFEDERGGFFFTADDHEALIHKPKPFADEALPAGNGVAANVLVTLGHLLGEQRYLDAAERTVRAALHSLERYAEGHPTLLRALDALLAPPQIVVVRAPPTAFDAWRTARDAIYDMRRLTFTIPTDAADLRGLLAERTSRGENGTAYVCEGLTCRAPIDTPEALTSALATPSDATDAV
jgi:uncharacterized protein YyaL (SSP411 family)